MAELKLMVVTPEKTLLDCQSESVVVPLMDGLMGFLPGHAPMIGRLGPGVMKVQQSSGSKKYFLEGGFVQMDNNVLSVLTNVAIPVEQLKAADLEAKLKSLDRATPETPAEKLSHDRQVAQTKAMLRAVNSANAS
ncbi:MAG: ATP synthase F1 subunit epsilon [Planctomycetaceae bacterium]|nr:ATP synthase F1 subunit epsilon [Planctomycetaceae bacterium]